MSVKVSTWVWHDRATEDLKGSQMIVLLALADISDDEGHVRFVSGKRKDGEQKALARKARVSVASFRRLTHQLEELGLLEISRESQTAPNRYRLLTSAQCERSEAVTAQNERLPVSGQAITDERSQRSPVSGHSSYRRTDVTTDVGEAAQRRGRRIPEDFTVTSEMVDWARREVPLVDGARSTASFIDYWTAASGRNATKRDWVAAWRNWLRKDQQDAERRGGPRRSVVEHGRTVDQMLADREAGQQLAVTS